MSRIPCKSLLLASFALTLLFAGLTAAQALPTAGANRPAGVPEDYIVTPAGYFHPSCVAHLAEGDVLLKDEKAIQHKDGSFDAMHVCAYSHFKPSGEEVTGEEKPATAERSVKHPTIGHAWVEYASTTTGSSFGELGSNWYVPAAPSAHTGQTIYLFPGMQDYADGVTIIQPVLGWNSDYSNAWGIASWNCCVTGTVYEAAPQPVNVGDYIEGYMWDNCASGTLTCSSWDILTYDLTAGRYSELMSTSNFGQTFNWAFGGALEVYNVSECSDYPPAGSFSFINLELYNDSFAEYSNPGWSYSNASAGLTPQCGYGGTVSPAQVTLRY
jgi:hypothetical protein